MHGSNPYKRAMQFWDEIVHQMCVPSLETCMISDTSSYNISYLQQQEQNDGDQRFC